MTDSLGNPGAVIQSATYGPANQLLTMTSPYGNWGSETRTYNSMLQLTQLTSGSSVNIAYYYYNSLQNNNGKITSQVDAISGEQVNYTYDSLNRLATAVTSDNPNVTQWGQSYAYDGFGNLTDQTTIKGSAPELHVTFNESTNQQTGSSPDANGNPGSVNGSTATYDEENRLVSTGSVYSTLAYYSYAPGNKRVWRGIWTWDPNQYLSVQTTDEITFWGVSGQKLARYQLTVSGSALYASQTEACYYFGSKLIKNAKGWVHTDRLGSIGKFYPYGVERPSATTNGTEKFTGYLRDSETGLDYAEQRYESPGSGRFMTPDSITGYPADPSSWNLYAYTRGDPINRVDPNGMQDCDPENPDCYCQIYGDSDSHCDPNYCPPGICGDDRGDPGNGLPSCSSYMAENGITPTQLFDFLTITQDASRLGLNLSGFNVTFPTGMQIAGGQGPSPGIPADMTELVLTGNADALQELKSSMCGIQSGYNSSTPNCFANAGFDLLHQGSPGNQINFRQDTPTDSMQITGTLANGAWTLSIDIDPNNPMAASVGFLRHASDVIRNGFTGLDTDYGKVAKDLGVDPYQNNGYCNP